MNDESAQHSHHLLHRHVRVIKESSVLAQWKLVHEALARHHRFLSDAGNAIHLVGELEPVPVYARWFRQVVLEEDADLVSLARLNRRSRRASVEAPEIEDLS